MFQHPNIDAAERRIPSSSVFWDLSSSSRFIIPVWSLIPSFHLSFCVDIGFEILDHLPRSCFMRSNFRILGQPSNSVNPAIVLAVDGFPWKKFHKIFSINGAICFVFLVSKQFRELYSKAVMIRQWGPRNSAKLGHGFWPYPVFDMHLSCLIPVWLRRKWRGGGGRRE